MDLTIFDRFCGSTFWDSELSWNTTIPRLTPCFERTVLVWLPTLFLLAFCVIDVYVTLSSNSRNIPWNWKNRGQLVILGLISITQIIDLSYNLNRREEVFLVDIYTPVIKCISLVLCGTLVVLHRNYGQRSSGLLFIFWLLMVLTGSSQFYTDLEGQLTSGRGELLRITYIITYCLSIILFLMQWLTDLPPIDNKYPKTKGKENPEESASFPSRMTFSWFNSLIWKGYRNPLTSSDLWSTKYQDSAAELFAAFNKHWEPTYNRFSNSDKMMNCGPKGMASFDHISETVKKDPKKPASILLALLKTFGPAYFIATSLQTMDVMLEFISPVLLKMMINFVSSNEPQWRGYLYAVMFLLVSLMKAFIQVQYNVRVGFVGLRIRTAVTSAIYRKALKLSNSARKDSRLGEIVNLMSVDSQSLMNSLTFMNSLLFAPLYIGLALYFLWQQLGPCALTGLAVILVMIPLNSCSLRITKRLQAKQMKYKDERTKMMNEVLSGMKVLKLYTWEPSFQEKISAIRNKEVKILKKSAILKSITLYFWSLAPILVALLTFIVYALVDESHVLDSAKVFVSMSLFNIMQNPLILVPIVITNLATASVSLKRINRFLNLEELDPARISYEDQDEDPLVIENGTFSWDSNEEPILHNINLRVKPGLLVAVVGAIGCGKSSLISAFLAEMYKSFGNVNTKGSIAYVPQVAWIQNSTLQDNILFGKSLDRKRYNNVIEACSLRQDLEMITGGDQCEIGERGINISGGQKQRISLARAVYANCDVYFLDDPLSAVDAHVGKHIFENVIGPKGILGRKTRLLVTHGVSFLPEVDLIVVLKDGMISELGTYRELLDKKGAFSEFLISHLHEIDEEELEDLDVVIREEIISSNPELHRHLSRQKSVNSFTGSVSSLKKRRLSQISQKLLSEEPKGQKLIEEEKSKLGRAGWSVYSDYLSSVGITLFLATLVLTILQQGLGVGANYWLSIMADDKDLVVNGTQNIEKRNLYLIVYGILGACQTSANFLGSLAWFIGAANATNILHFALLYNIMRSPMSFFDTTPLGRILNRFAKEIDVVDSFLPFAFRQSLSFLFSAISTLCIISYSTPIFIAVIVPVMVLYYMVQKLYIATSQQLKRMESSSRSPIYSHFGETVIGATVIRAYSAQDRFIKDSENKVDINQDFGYLIIIASRWLMIRFQLIGNTIIFFSALFAVIGKDYLSPGLVGLSLSYTLQVTGILNMLFTMSADIETNIVAVERIKEYTITPQEAAWDITPSTIGPDWPHEGRVELVGYCLRYRKGLDMVLKGINLVINGGEKVGIVGRTGAGKSSVTLGLFRIIEPDGGKILIDGVDISKLGLHSVRSCLTIIPQDPVLFSGSLRMNLDPFDRFSDEQVWRAMELAGLKPFVKGLAAGLQHEVAEGGENISVGQRQLICLARALLRKTKILILDEATAAVDLETDDIIQKTIRSEFADCTVLTIAHRINTIMDSDKVLVLDHGSVLEYDSPSELLKNKSSSFYSMAHEAGVV